MKLCSKSIVFVPKEIQFPIIKVGSDIIEILIASDVISSLYTPEYFIYRRMFNPFPGLGMAEQTLDKLIIP